MRRLGCAIGAVLLLSPLVPAMAASGSAESPLPLGWGLPFAGILLSIALLPLLAGRLWQHHDGKIAAGWAALFVLPFAALQGIGAAWHSLAQALIEDYLPFITLLLALYTTGGGVVLRGRLVGTPGTNLALLAVGTLAASVMGTTGASMLLIRPLLRANAFRRRKTHSFVFFIFLVGNVGGALTPLGDPPLYLGFLQGVGFFWPTVHVFPPFAVAAVILLAAYWALDSWHWARERQHAPPPALPAPLHLQGGINLLLIAVVVVGVLMQGVWHPGSVTLLGVGMGIERLAAMALFLAVTAASMAWTRPQLREDNGFTWHAMAEVARLFAAIFVTMAPVLAILRAGSAGAAAPLVALTTDAAGAGRPAMYFWLAGGLSSFLDNAPTYLVFFNLAGGDAGTLMGPAAPVLVAISCGAVFMGANSYIGNAPNFMIKAIVERQGERMPSFFGYMAWAGAVLLPVFLLLTLLFFRP